MIIKPYLYRRERHSIRHKLIFGWVLLLFSGFAAASGLATALSPESVGAREQKILVLGDSISAAYGMSLEQGWVAQLQTQLREEAPDLNIVNASISGETTVGGLRRLPALLAQHHPSLVLIELGANDGLRGYPLKTLRQNLEQMVTLSQQSGATVVLLPMEVPPNYGARYATGFRESFVKVARETGSEITAFLLEGVATDAALMQDDGLHPTAAAQSIIMNNALPAIRAALAQP